MNRRHAGAIAVVFAGAIAAALIAAMGPEPEQSAGSPAPPTVTVVPVSMQTVQMTVTTHGEVVPRSESDLVPEVSGRVVAVARSMVSGGFFAKDDVLVEIERVDYEAALEQTRADLASARSDLATAERAFNRHVKLSETDSISESLYDAATNRLTVARASLRRAAAQEARARRDLERTRIVAPYDGRVRSERIEVGQFVQRGEPVASLYSIDFAEVSLPVHDRDMAFLPVSLGLTDADPLAAPKVVLRAPFAGVEHSWDGIIVRAEGELDTGTRMVNLIAQVAAPYRQGGDTPPLTAGLFVAADIVGKAFEDIVVLPRAALHANGRVHVVSGEGKLARRQVDVLRVTGNSVYVAAGLAEGEMVCVSVPANPLDGQLVQTELAATARSP